ncbi:MAG: Uma2 family endonuclease [Clostridiales bacterium]|nr:Uma2 family endonuclease [Clostridiales bacterium]
MNSTYEYAEEILNGEVFLMSPRPDFAHDDTAHIIKMIFRRNLKKLGCKVLVEPDVYLVEKLEQVVPDVAIICDKRKLGKRRVVYGAPDLIVEVLSPSTRNRDKGYKKDLYEKHGVKEYWLVNVRDLSIEVFILDGGKYRLDNTYELPPYWELEEMTEEELAAYTFEFTPHQFKDLIVDIREVFEDVD